MHLEVENIKKINLKEGEILLIKIDNKNRPQSYFKKTAENYAKAVKEILPEGVRVMIIPEGITFSAVTFITEKNS